jgi:hypothetical protein
LSKASRSGEYCGFVCGFALDDIQKVLDEIKLLSDYNPQFAVEFLDKIIKMLYDTRAELAAINK